MAGRKKLSIGPSSARRGTRRSSRIKNSQNVLEESSAVSREAAVSHASSSATRLPLLEFDDDRAIRNEEPPVTSAALGVGTSGEQRPRTEGDVSTSSAGDGEDLKLSFPFPSDLPVSSSSIKDIGLSCSSLPRNLTRSPTHAAHLSTPSPAHTEIPVSAFLTDNPKEYLTFSNNVVASIVDTPVSTSPAIYGDSDSGAFFFKNDFSALPHISDNIPISAPMHANISQQSADDSSGPFASRVDMPLSPQEVNKAGEPPHGLQFSLPAPVVSSVSTASPKRGDIPTSLFTSPDVRMLSAIGVNIWVPSPNGSEISASSPINSHVSTPLLASPYISTMPSPISGDISDPTDVGTDMCVSSQVSTGVPEMSPVNDINGTSYTENHLKFPDDDNSAAFSTNTDISTHFFACGELSARAISTNTPFPIDDNVSGISPKGDIDDTIFDTSCRDHFIHVPSSVDAVTYNLSSDTAVAIATKFEVAGSDDHAATSSQLLTPATNAILNPTSPPSILAGDSSFPLSSTNVATAPSLQHDAAPQVAVSTGLHSSSSSQQPDSLCSLLQQNPAPHLTFAKNEDIPGTTLRSNTISDQPFVSQCGVVHPSNGNSLSVASFAEETFSNSGVLDSSEISSVYVSDPPPYVIIGDSAQTSESSFLTAGSLRNPKRANSLEFLDNPASSLWSSCNVAQSSLSSVVFKQQPADTVVPESCTYSVGCKSPLPLCDIPTSSVKGVVNKGSSNCICVGQTQFKRSDREPFSVESAAAVSSASLTIVTKSVDVVSDLQPNIPVLLLCLHSNSNDGDHPDPCHGGQISTSLPQPFDTDDSVPNLIEITVFEPSLVSHSTPETSPISVVPCSGLKSSPSLHFSDQDLFPSIDNILGSSSNISNSTLASFPNKKSIASESIKNFFSQKYVDPELPFTGNERSDLTPSGVPVEEVSVSCDFATEDLLTSTAVCDSSVKTNVSAAHNVAFTDSLALSQDSSVTESTSIDTDVSMSLPIGGNLSQPFPIDTDPMFCPNEKNDHVLSLTNSNVSKLPPFENNVCKLLPLETDIPMPFAYEGVGFLPPCVTDSSLPSALTVAVSKSSSIPSLFNIPHPATSSSSGNDIQEPLLSNPKTTSPPLYDIPIHCSTEAFIEHSHVFPLPAPSTKEDETTELFSSQMTVPHISLDNEPSSQLHIPESHGICSSFACISLSDPSCQDSLKETLATHSAPRVATPFPLWTPHAIFDPYTSLKTMTDLRPRIFYHATDTPSQNVDTACLSSRSWITDTSFLQESSIAAPSNESSKTFISHNSPPRPSFDEIIDGLSFLLTTECQSEPTDFLHNEPARTNDSEAAVLPETVKFGAQTEDSVKESCGTSNSVVQSNNTKHRSPTGKSTRAKIVVLNFPIISKLATNNSMPRHSTNESFLVAKPCDDFTPECSPLRRRSDIFEALRKGEPLAATIILNGQTNKSQRKSQQKLSKEDKTPKSAPNGNKTLLASFSLSAQLKSNSHTTKNWIESCTASSELESEFSLREFGVTKSSDTQASDTATKRDNKKKDKVLPPLPNHSSKFCSKHTMPSSLQSTKPLSLKQDVKTRSLTMKTPLTQLLSETSEPISQAPKSSDKNISQDPKSKGKIPKCEVKDQESNLVPSDGSSGLKYMEKEQVQSKPVLVVSDMSSNVNPDTDSNCDARSPSGSSVAPPSKLRWKKSLSDVYNSIRRMKMKRPKSKTSESKSSHLRSLHAKSLLPSKYSKFKISPQIFKSKLHRQQSLSTLTSVDSAFQSQTALKSVADETAVPKCDALALEEQSSSQPSKVPANDVTMADALFSKKENRDISPDIGLESSTTALSPPDTPVASMLPPEESLSPTHCQQLSAEIKSPESKPSSSSHLHSGLQSTLHICKSHTQEHSPSQSSKRWFYKQKSFSLSSQTSKPQIQNYSLSSEDKTQTKICCHHMLSMSQRLTTGASYSGLQMANEAEMLHTEAKRKPSRRSPCYFMNTKERARCRSRCKRQKGRRGGPNYRTRRPNTDNRRTNKYRSRRRTHFNKHGVRPYDRSRTKIPSRRYAKSHENVMQQLDNHYQNEPLFDHGSHLFQDYEGEDWSLDMHSGTVGRICTICSFFYRTFENDLVLYCYVCREMVVKIASRLKACMCISCLEPFVRVVEEEEEEDVCAECLQKGVVAT